MENYSEQLYQHLSSLRSKAVPCYKSLSTTIINLILDVIKTRLNELKLYQLYDDILVFYDTDPGFKGYWVFADIYGPIGAETIDPIKAYLKTNHSIYVEKINFGVNDRREYFFTFTLNIHKPDNASLSLQQIET